MSSITSFKQKCPSCGGQLTIKNSDLIGKKVDCPKCKHRFVVESPDEAPKPKKDSGRRERIADEDRPRKKKAKGGKGMLILGCVTLGVVVVVGIILLVTLGGGDSKTPPVAEGKRGGAAPSTTETKPSNPFDQLDSENPQPAKDKIKEQLQNDAERDAILDKLREKILAGNQAAKDLVKDLAANATKPDLQNKAKLLLADIEKQLAADGGDPKNDPTNFLPNNTQVVLYVPIAKLLNTNLGGQAFFVEGAFRMEDFNNHLGIELNKIQQYVLGADRRHGSSILAVVRTTEPFSWDIVRQALQIDPATKQTVNGKDYYLGKVDFLNEFIGTRIGALASLRQKAAVCRKDDRTLLYGDEPTVKQFLTQQPAFQNAPPPQADQGPGGGASGGNDGPASAGAGGRGRPPEDGPRSTGAGGGSAAPPPSQQPGGSAPAQGGGKFMTVDPKLRALIERAQHQKRPLILYAEKGDRESPTTDMYYLADLIATQRSAVTMIAMALHLESQLSLRIVAACRDKDIARPIRDELEKLLTKAADEKLREITGIKFQVGAPADDQPADQPNNPGGYGGGTPPGGMPPGGGPAVGGGGSRGTPPGGMPGGGGVITGPPPSGGGGGAMQGPPNRGRGPGMEGPSDDGGVGGGPGRGKGGQRNPNPPPGAGGGGGRPADDAKPPDTSNSRIDVSRSDEYITIDVTVGDKTDKFIDNELANWMIRRRAEGDMSSGRVFLGDLAATLNAYNRDSTRPLVYPYGAHPRDTNQARGWRPYPPFERVSWMRELLPFMGDTRYMEMHGAIDPNKSWRDEDNLKVARILVSQFVYPGAGSYFTRVRGVDREVAVTHFVGMAGVGPDAPYYPKSDPRAGIFGYDRQMSLSDITDGASNTIYAIQTDPGVAGPWLAGGGSTIRGTSGGNDVGQRGGFISPNYKGKAGAYALMADGSIRFITKDVDQKVFEALCTAHGGDSVGDIEGAAPKVNVPPSLPRLSSSPPPAASGDAGGPKPGGKVKKDEDESGGAPAKPPAGDKKPAGDKSSGNAKSGDEDESGKQGKPGEPKKP